MIENDKSAPMPVDRVRFIDSTLTQEAFCASYGMRTPQGSWDALITYSNGINEYFEIQAKSMEECANELRRRGIL